MPQTPEIWVRLTPLECDLIKQLRTQQELEREKAWGSVPSAVRRKWSEKELRELVNDEAGAWSKAELVDLIRDTLTSDAARAYAKQAEINDAPSRLLYYVQVDLSKRLEKRNAELQAAIDEVVAITKKAESSPFNAVYQAVYRWLCPLVSKES